MRRFTSTTMVMDCPPVVDWADGLGTTMKRVRIKGWATPRRSSGIGLPAVTVASRRAGRRCKSVLQVRTHPSWEERHWQRAWSRRSSETELETRRRAAVETETQEKRRGRVTKIPNSLLSLSKMIEARRKRDQKETGAASKNASLKNAPSGTNVGVHFSGRSWRTPCDQCQHQRRPFPSV